MAPIAPLVAGHWPRRLGAKAGPLGAPGGSGELLIGANLQVELFINGTWVDITSYVMTRDGSTNISITRGQPNEGSAVEPSRCMLQLNNRDGRFSPRNPMSPYYGQLGRNQPIRVSVPLGNTKNYRFWGEVAAWPLYWDSTGRDVWVSVEAASLLRRLGQGASPLQSPMRRELSGPRRPSIVAYWPMEDGSAAGSLASAVPEADPMTVTGVIGSGQYSGWAASEPLPTMGTGTVSGPVPAYTAGSELSLRFFLRVAPGGVASPQRVLSLVGTGTAAAWSIWVDAAGELALRAYNAGGVQVYDSGWRPYAVNSVLLSLGLELTQVGSDVSYNLYGYDIGRSTIDRAVSIGITTSTVSSVTVGAITQVRIGEDLGLGDTAVGHVALANNLAAYASTSGAMVAWDGESPSARLSRLCSEEGITYTEVSDGTVADSVLLGAQGTKTLNELVAEAVTADGGIQFEPTTGIGVGFRARPSLYDQGATLVMPYSGALAAAPQPIDDDRYTSNDVIVRRAGGSSARATLDAGPLSVQSPPTGVGRYASDITLSLHSDDSIRGQAGWRLALGTVDETRYPQISINLAHPAFQPPSTLRAQALGVQMGDRLVIAGPPIWLSPNDISQIVLGSSEQIDGFQHLVTYSCAPESPYRVLALDDPLYGRLDGSASTLDQPVGSTDTILSVASSSGTSWTTSLADSPFDLVVAGERVTVVAVGQQLAVNPFISGLTGWTAQSSTIAASTAFVNTAAGAAASLQITPDGVAASGGVVGQATAVGSITPGQTYTVCMWAYSPGGWSDLRPAVDWYDSGGVFLSSGLGSGTSAPAAQWTFIQQTLTAPASASSATPRARHGGTPPATAVWYAWAIRLVPTASVTSSSPQQVSVVRSVNGISKALPAGSAVNLFQPVVLAL